MTEMTHGGARKGAGRKPSYGEPTKAMRIPLSQTKKVKTMLSHATHHTDIVYPALNPIDVSVPVALSRVPAGLPAAADDDVERYMDLNKHLIRTPLSTFMWYVTGDSMRDAGILSGDMVIVDRSLEAQHNNIVIAEVNGEPTIKKLHYKDDIIELRPENPDYPVITFSDHDAMNIWGVVRSVIRDMM